MLDNAVVDVRLVFSLILLVILVAITFIDFVSYRIPNILNFALAVFGLGWQFLNTSNDLVYQICFAVGLFLIFYSVQHVYSKMTGKMGLGMGDVKMAGAAGLWMSPFNFPFFIFIASFSGLVFAIIKFGFQRSTQIPFGPFLALSLILIWGWENYI